MILEIVFPLLTLIYFSISDFKIGGVKFILLLAFVVSSLIINFYVIHTDWLLFILSAFIGILMYKMGTWGSADGYILIGLTTFLQDYYSIFLWTLVFMQVMMDILTYLVEHISYKTNLSFPYIPFMSLGFLYVLPKLIVDNMG